MQVQRDEHPKPVILVLKPLQTALQVSYLLVQLLLPLLMRIECLDVVGLLLKSADIVAYLDLEMVILDAESLYRLVECCTSS
jgi:hypothetical protein